MKGTPSFLVLRGWSFITCEVALLRKLRRFQSNPSTRKMNKYV